MLLVTECPVDIHALLAVTRSDRKRLLLRLKDMALSCPMHFQVTSSEAAIRHWPKLIYTGAKPLDNVQ